MADKTNSETAEVVLACTDLEDSIEFFTKEVGLRLESIYPADQPRIAIMSGYGLSIRLEISGSAKRSQNARLRIPGPKERTIVSPDGIAVDFVSATRALSIPPPAVRFSINRGSSQESWVTGRAGMKYRDLITNRLGGFLIASQIHISKAGPVPDYVHYHHVRFQLIFCLKGWARLVYEDQGAPFVFESGDCVLQPPGIRHRVLETSGDFDVVEVSCPAEHETVVEHELELPNDVIDHERLFGDQKFVWSKASESESKRDENSGFEVRKTGIEAASGGKVDVSVIRFNTNGSETGEWHNGEICFLYVIKGGAAIAYEDTMSELHSGDAILIPSRTKVNFEKSSDDFELLQVTLFETRASD